MRVVNRAEVPATEARAVEVAAGQRLRVIASEGPQVGDLFVVAAADRAKSLSSHITCSLNGRSLRRAARLHAGPPGFEVLLSVTHDPHGVHWVHGRCTAPFYETYDGEAGRRNCHDNISAALAPYGYSDEDVPLDTFNVFMTVHVDADGHYEFGPPSCVTGDYMEFRAEQDVLAVLSACPATDVLNAHQAKGMRLEVLEGS
jgi:uncharacterized protein